MKKPELLAPAGSLDKLKTAVIYGADAVYIGGEEYSLRTASENFTIQDMEKGVRFAHDRKAKVYVACNTVPHNNELALFPSYLKDLVSVGADAVIVTDLGLFSLAREHAPDLEVHISTQANTANYETCRAWHRMGAARVVLARELNLEEIKEIRQKTPETLSLEGFVHGAMCMSHSGRCLLSSFMAHRDANRGDCAHPCRWKYYLTEEKRPGEYMPVFETATGTFILNSKDLCMIEHIPALVNAGIDSLKIEGRVKSDYYVACVTGAYRSAIDACFEDMEKYQQNRKKYFDEVCKVSHREYYTGFYFGDEGKNGQVYPSSGYIREYEVVGYVNGYDHLTRTARVTQKNKFLLGEILEVLSPMNEPASFRVTEMRNAKGEEIYSAPHPEMELYLKVPFPIAAGSYLRKEK